MGGCDGAHKERSYYTEFVKQTPKDSIILTLACGKYRFNDMDLGEIRGLPRIMDMGQCNDAYGAIQVAVALLYLGMKDIYLGPKLPAFLSPGVLDMLVKEYRIHPVSDPESDLREILG